MVQLYSCCACYGCVGGGAAPSAAVEEEPERDDDTGFDLFDLPVLL